VAGHRGGDDERAGSALLEVCADGLCAVEGSVEIGLDNFVPGFDGAVEDTLMDALALSSVIKMGVAGKQRIKKNIPESAVRPALAMNASIFPNSLITSATSLLTLSQLPMSSL
jgi:hypothetical protein